MYYYRYPKYVSVGERRAKAERKLKQYKKKNPDIAPVIIEGRSLAKNWWGKSWNSNLERYADYSNRIGRGRSYVRNGAVLDLQINAGQIDAIVQGSRSTPYDVLIKVKSLGRGCWATIRKACEGSFDSLSDLLSGKFPKSLKDLFFQKDAGLFPSPKDIEFDCSCPDWAVMCKHVAATLYGVGARLDSDPSLFFTLRGIDIDDLVTQTVADTAKNLLDKARSQSENVLENVDLGDVFGIQMDDFEALAAGLPPVKRKDSTTKKNNAIKKGQKSVAKQRIDKAEKRIKKKRISRQSKKNTVKPKLDNSCPATGKTLTINAISGASNNQGATMLEMLLTAIGRTRKGKSTKQLQEKLGWTKAQIRNALSRAKAKELLEPVVPGVYRKKISSVN